MAVLSTLKELGESLVGPYLFMSIAMRFLPGTLFEVISNRDFRTLFSLSRFKDAWFGNFWAFIGPQVKSNAEKRVIPLLEGRVTNGHVEDEVVGEPINGVVLEIGAGTGMWADVFAKVNVGVNTEEAEGELRRRKGDGGLTRVYGIEPNPKSAATLRRRVKEIGLDGVYEVVPVGIESINDPKAWDGRIEPESVDCIVTILCLCSIPEPEKNIKLLYQSLKKGGRWYAYEHVRISENRGFFLRAYQCESAISTPTRIIADNDRGYWSRVVASHGVVPYLPIYRQDVERSWAMGEDRSSPTGWRGEICDASPRSWNIDKVKRCKTGVPSLDHAFYGY
jgi:SAM-dependent methyltransferase